MPIFDITHPVTGRTISVEGPSPPSKNIIDQLFANNTPEYSDTKEWAKAVGRGALGVGGLFASAAKGASNIVGKRGFDVNPQDNPVSQFLDKPIKGIESAKNYIGRDSGYEQDSPVNTFLQDQVEGAIPFVGAAAVPYAGRALPALAGLSTHERITQEGLKKGKSAEQAMGEADVPSLAEAGMFAAMHGVKKNVMGDFNKSGVWEKGKLGLNKPKGILDTVGREAAFVGPYLHTQGEVVQGAELGTGAIDLTEYGQRHGYDPNTSVGDNIKNVGLNQLKGLGTSALVGAGFGVTAGLKNRYVSQLEARSKQASDTVDEALGDMAKRENEKQQAQQQAQQQQEFQVNHPNDVADIKSRIQSPEGISDKDRARLDEIRTTNPDPKIREQANKLSTKDTESIAKEDDRLQQEYEKQRAKQVQEQADGIHATHDAHSELIDGQGKVADKVSKAQQAQQAVDAQDDVVRDIDGRSDRDAKNKAKIKLGDLKRKAEQAQAQADLEQSRYDAVTGHHIEQGNIEQPQQDITKKFEGRTPESITPDEARELANWRTNILQTQGKDSTVEQALEYQTNNSLINKLIAQRKLKYENNRVSFRDKGWEQQPQPAVKNLFKGRSQESVTLDSMGGQQAWEYLTSHPKVQEFAQWAKDKAVTFKEFSKNMISEFGDKVKQYLIKLWNGIKSGAKWVGNKLSETRGDSPELRDVVNAVTGQPTEPNTGRNVAVIGTAGRDKTHRSIHRLSEQPVESKTLKGKMSFAYGDNKRPDIASTTTADAIRSGERTATTRYESDGSIDYWKNANVGDIIEFDDGKGGTVRVRVTKPAYKLKGSGITPEQWSKLEGWSTQYFRDRVLPKLDGAWQIQYELIKPEDKKAHNELNNTPNIEYPKPNRIELGTNGMLHLVTAKKEYPALKLSTKNIDSETGRVEPEEDSPIKSIPNYSGMLATKDGLFVELTGLPEGATKIGSQKYGAYDTYQFNGIKVTHQLKASVFGSNEPGRYYININSVPKLLQEYRKLTDTRPNVTDKNVSNDIRDKKTNELVSNATLDLIKDQYIGHDLKQSDAEQSSEPMQDFLTEYEDSRGPRMPAKGSHSSNFRAKEESAIKNIDSKREIDRNEINMILRALRDNNAITRDQLQSVVDELHKQEAEGVKFSDKSVRETIEEVTGMSSKDLFNDFSGEEKVQSSVAKPDFPTVSEKVDHNLVMRKVTPESKFYTQQKARSLEIETKKNDAQYDQLVKGINAISVAKGIKTRLEAMTNSGYDQEIVKTEENNTRNYVKSEKLKVVKMIRDMQKAGYSAEEIGNYILQETGVSRYSDIESIPVEEVTRLYNMLFSNNSSDIVYSDMSSEETTKRLSDVTSASKAQANIRSSATESVGGVKSVLERELNNGKPMTRADRVNRLFKEFKSHEYEDTDKLVTDAKIVANAVDNIGNFDVDTLADHTGLDTKRISDILYRFGFETHEQKFDLTDAVDRFILEDEYDETYDDAAIEAVTNPSKQAEVINREETAERPKYATNLTGFPETEEDSIDWLTSSIVKKDVEVPVSIEQLLRNVRSFASWQANKSDIYRIAKERGFKPVEVYAIARDVGFDISRMNMRMARKEDVRLMLKTAKQADKTLGSAVDGVRNTLETSIMESERTKIDIDNAVKSGAISPVSFFTYRSIAEGRYTLATEVDNQIPGTVKASHIFTADVNQPYKKNNIILGKFKNDVVQKTYEKLANILGADLQVVSGGKEFKSRYIPESKADGKSRIVINVDQSENSAHIFGHELFHHIKNKIGGSDYELFTKSIDKLLDTKQFEDLKKLKNEYNDIEEFHADVFGKVFIDREFWRTLASTSEGKTLAGKMLDRLVFNFKKLVDYLSSIPGRFVGTYDSKNYIDSTTRAMYQLFGDLMIKAEKSNTIEHKDTKYYGTPKEILEQVRNKNSFTKEAGSLFDVISDKAKELWKDIQDKFGKYMYAAYGATPEVKRLMYTMANKPNLDLVYEHGRLKDNYRKFFNTMSPEQHIEIQDLIRTMNQSKELSERNAAKEKLFALNDGKVGRFFDDVQENIEGIHKRLQEYYPEMGKLEYHFGQHLKHFFSGETIDTGFEDMINDLHKSALKGKGEDITKTQSDILPSELIAKGAKFVNLNPYQVYMNYVHMSSKLLGVLDMLKSAKEQGLRYDLENGEPLPKDKKDWVTLSDNALKILENVDLTEGFKINLGKNKYYKDPESGSAYVFKSKEEADTFIKDNPELFEETDAKVDKVNRDTEFTKNVFTINHPNFKKPYQFESRDKANEFMDEQRRRTTEWADNNVLERNREKAIEKAMAKYEFKSNVVARTEEERHVKQIYVPQDMARMLNVYLSKDVIKSSAAGRMAAAIKNEYTAWELGLSAFHAITMQMELTSSYAAQAWTDKNSTLLAKIPIFNLPEATRSNNAINDMYDKIISDPKSVFDDNGKFKNQNYLDTLTKLVGKTSAENFKELMENYHLAGGIRNQDASVRDYGTKTNPDFEGTVFSLKKNDWSKWWDSVKEDSKRNSENNDSKLFAGYSTTRNAVLNSVTGQLFEHFIPRVKFAQFAREYSKAVEEQRELIDNGVKTKLDIAIDTNRFIEDRFGEMNWENLWMNKTLSGTLKLFFRSFTWVYGTQKALYGAGKNIINDQIKNGIIKPVLKGNKPTYELNEKGVWGIAALASHIFASSIITTLATGKPPLMNDDEDDVGFVTKLMFPRMSSSDPTKRMSLPSYATEFWKTYMHLMPSIVGGHFEPSKMVTGRFNGVVGKLFDVMRNQDFEGTVIRDSNESPLAQTWDVLSYMTPIPISVKTVAEDLKTDNVSAKNIATGMFGFTQAPATAKRDAATNLAYDLSRREYKGKEISHEEAKHKLALKKMRVALERGDDSVMNRMISNGEISEETVKREIEKIPKIGTKDNQEFVPELDRIVHYRLELANALKVYDKATDSEKERLKPILLKKYDNVIKRGDKSELQKEEYTKLMDKYGLTS